MSNNNNNREDHIPSIIEPQPIHHRTSSYGEKFEKQKGRLSDEVFPPSPVKTPRLDESSPSKPYLVRSNTSNYLSELKHRTDKDQGRPVLTNAPSVSDAYHLQQRRDSKEENPTLLVDTLPDTGCERRIHPDRHSGLFDHPPSFNEDVNSHPGSDHDIEEVLTDGQRVADISNRQSEEVGNDVNQFKRRFSWWSKN